MKRILLVLVLLVLATGSDCPLVAPCGADDLDIRLVPTRLALAVGDTASVRIERGSCHWANRLPDANVRWTIDSVGIATVDSTTGFVVARAAGQATLTARGAANEIAGSIPLIVR
jgi:Bacterial Ig-like domain (group 2)